MSSLPAALLVLLAFARENPSGDASLARRIKNGDHSAFRRFFDRHHGRLLGYLRSRGVPDAEAEDIVQTAFLYVWQHRSEIDPDQSLRAYLFRIGYTRALNHFRDESKIDGDAEVDRVPSSAHSSPEAEALNAELQAQIDEAIAALPERRRAVFELCFLRDFTYREAAEALDIARKTVENHMRLALRDLRASLQEDQ